MTQDTEQPRTRLDYRGAVGEPGFWVISRHHGEAENLEWTSVGSADVVDMDDAERMEVQCTLEAELIARALRVATDEELAEAGLVREGAYRQACEDDLSRALGIRSGRGWRNLLQGVAALRRENARFQDTLNTEHGHASAAMSRIESALSGGAS